MKFKKTLATLLAAGIFSCTGIESITGNSMKDPKDTIEIFFDCLKKDKNPIPEIGRTEYYDNFATATCVGGYNRSKPYDFLLREAKNIYEEIKDDYNGDISRNVTSHAISGNVVEIKVSFNTQRGGLSMLFYLQEESNKDWTLVCAKGPIRRQ